MSEGIQGIEPIIVAIQARLEADLPAEIQVTNDDVTDGFRVDDVYEVLDYIPAVGEVKQFPTVGLLHGSGQFEDDNGWSATGVYRVGIVSFVQHAEPEGISRVIRRFTRAVTRVAAAGRQIGTTPWGMTVEVIDYGPSLAEVPDGGGAPSRYITWSTVTIVCRQDEGVGTG